MAEKILGSVCLNHPDVPAIANCATCRKPICKECIHSKNNVVCCSEQCLINAVASAVVTDDILKKKKAVERKKLVKKIITLIILLIILGFAWKNKDSIKKLFEKGKAETEKIINK